MKKLALLLALALPVLAQPNIPFDPWQDQPTQDGGPQPCWGSDQPCPDGRYRDREGKVQPETCNNYKTTAEAHRCACNRATQCPETDENGMAKPMHEDSKCQVYCRGDHCHCIGPCDN
jgi:hypothetical protein